MQTQIDSAVKALQEGGVIAYPTEAVYGLGCDPGNESALQKLLALKQRDPGKGLILIASHIEQLYAYIDIASFDLRAEIKQQWPGAVTWVMPCKNNISATLTGGRTTIAVRVSAHPVVVQLCETFNGAVVSTSANVSGQAPFKNAAPIQTHFGDQLSAIIDAPLGTTTQVTSIFDAQSGQQLR